MFRIVEQTQAQMQKGYFSSSDIYVDGYGKLTLVNRNLQTNLALNKPYTKTLNSSLSSADTGNKMFTDGIKGGQAWFRYSSTLTEDITVDLGYETFIGGTQFFTGTTATSSQHYIDIYLSRDNVNFDLVSRSGTGEQNQQEFKNSFVGKLARYVKFRMLRNTAGAMTVSEGEIYPGLTYTSYREQTYDLSSIGKLRTNNAFWIEDTPVGTSVVVETSISLDGGSNWTGWKPLLNGGSLQNISLGTDISNGRLKVRTTLTSNSISVPSFYNFNLYFDDVAKADENYIVIPRNGYSLNRINPDMTSANTPLPYLVAGKGVNEAAYPAWKLFDGISNTTYDQGWCYKTGSNIVLDLGDNFQGVSKYRIHRIIDGYYLSGFTLEASLDSINWTTVDKKAGLTWSATEKFKEFDLLSVNNANKNFYRYFKFSVDSITNSSSYFLTEIEFFAINDGNGYQISSKLTVPYSKSLPSHIYIPPNNRATGTVKILPIINFDLPSRINVKIHSNLTCRINVPINNRASAIVNIVKQPTKSLSLTPVKDAFVRESAPKLNYGTEQDIYAGYNSNFLEKYRTFIGFDLSSMPADSLIKSAHFKIYHELGNSPVQKVELYEVEREWTERGITWDNQPLPTNKIAELDVGVVGGYLDVDFTQLVQEWYEGTKQNKGFIIKLADESEQYYKRFYSRESRYSPYLEIEYVDKTVYTFEKIDLKNSHILVRQNQSRNINSKLNVRQIWFNEQFSCRIKVANMGTIDSHIVVKNPNLLSNLIVRQKEDHGISSKLLVRNKKAETINSTIIAIRKFMFGKIRVQVQKDFSLMSKVTVRRFEKRELSSNLIVTRKFLTSRIKVVKGELLPCTITVIRSGEKQFSGKLIVRRTEAKNFIGRVRVVQKALLPSKIFIKSGNLRSHISIPYRANMDTQSRITVRVKWANDMKSRIIIDDPYGDTLGYVYIL